jgi:hypothetical protein
MKLRDLAEAVQFTPGTQSGPALTQSNTMAPKQHLPAISDEVTMIQLFISSDEEDGTADCFVKTYPNYEMLANDETLTSVSLANSENNRFPASNWQREVSELSSNMAPEDNSHHQSAIAQFYRYVAQFINQQPAFFTSSSEYDGAVVMLVGANAALYATRLEQSSRID